MGASIFSLLMSLFWCSVFILVGIMWRKVMTLKHGAGFTLIVIAIGILRLFLPLDLPVSVIIRSTLIMPSAQQYFETPVLNTNDIAISKFDVLLAVWVAGSAIYLIWIIISLLRQKHWINKMELRPTPMVKEILEEIVSKSRPAQKFSVFETDAVRSPMLTGYFTPLILFPSITLSEKDTKYVLLHEWNHFTHKHLWIKLIFSIFCAILWWNPLVYMAKSDLDYILEVNCDRYVIRELEQNRRPEYVAALAEVIKQLNNSMRCPSGAVGFIGIVDSKIVQRCELILYPPRKLTRRAKSAILAFLAGLLLLSYAFIFQPIVPPPTDEALGGISVGISSENSYLITNDDGSFTLYINGNAVDVISHENIKKAPYSTLKIYN